ncbi:response regulator [Methylibium rhizosphaerae]|uniref:response regulator n=1 Tax=Methylibium rhizosphaerae TaxID=2570323 RepID=UPI001129E7CF|nr:response regulator [Methylibium rhizosphaerae]
MNTTDAALPVLVVGADRATAELLREWLADSGCAVEEDPSRGSGPGRYALIVVDVPYPRQGKTEPLQRMAHEYPGTPVIALSPTFHPSVEPSGEAARALGVHAVLPKPLHRGTLVAAAHRLLQLPPPPP